ncbi:MAG: hypothetical protein A3F67_00505 [Verrucomicrobia bacterium RIFCSPHIGHO2_12_FULL_41_10]|nr:MAG: hypothetical protein A3F67_00505 [Verrucomicrobia bacterium RIFCSPHIGHO2_12_FULL_41_10]HLB32750.1 MFS transporter [Chthoniobacterales bacterium]
MKRNIYFAYAAKLLGAFSYGVFFLLPLYINALGGNEALSGKLLLVSGIGTIACIFITKKIMNLYNIGIQFLGTIGALLCAVGALCMSLNMHLNNMLFLYMALVGAGWGISFNIAYCLASVLGNHNKTRFFSYMSAFSVLGMGIAPPCIKSLGLKGDFHTSFLIASISALLAAISFAFIKTETLKCVDSETNEKHQGALWEILKTKARFSLVMLLLGTCAFTVMMNFQSTYAKKLGLDYSVFYLLFTTSVVGSRLVITDYIAKYNHLKSIVFIELTMLIGVMLFAFVIDFKILYPIAAVLFGIGYGLSFPIIQTILVNFTKKQFHKDALSYFSLSYFIANYGFPYFAGKIIVNAGYQTMVLVLIGILAFDFLLSIVQYSRDN